MTYDRPGCFEIPSADIALHFARKARHTYGGLVPCPEIGVTWMACSGCKQLVSAEQFLSGRCPGEERTDA